MSVEPEELGCERSLLDPEYDEAKVLIVPADQDVGPEYEDEESFAENDTNNGAVGDDLEDVTAVGGAAARAACWGLWREEEVGVIVMTGVAVEVMMPEPSFLIFGLLRCRWNWRMSSWTEASSR